MGCGSSTSTGTRAPAPTQTAAAEYSSAATNDSTQQQQQQQQVAAGTGSDASANAAGQPGSSDGSGSSGAARNDAVSAGDPLHPPARRAAASKRLTLPNSGGTGTTALTHLVMGSASETDTGDAGATGGGNSSRRGSRVGRVGLTPPGTTRRLAHSDSHSDGAGTADSSAEQETLLVSIPFFESLDKKAIKKLRDAFRRKKYAEGEWISRQSAPIGAAAAAPTAAEGAPTEAQDHEEFFVIISGSVQLSVPVLTSKTVSSGAAETQQSSGGGGVNKRGSTNAFVMPPVLSSRPDPLALPATTVEEVVLAVLKAGQWFGAHALVADSFQKTNVRALDDTVLLSISRDEFKRFAADTEEMSTNIADVVSNTRISLRSLPFFATVDELKLQQLSQLLEFRRYASGDVVVQEGESGKGFFIIVSGTASVTVRVSSRLALGLGGGGGGLAMGNSMAGGDSEPSQTFLLNTLKEGEWFNETAILCSSPAGADTAPRSVATVTATSACLMLYLSISRFKSFAKLAPEVVNQAFESVVTQRTSQLLKSLPLFEVLCLSSPKEPPPRLPLQTSLPTLREEESRDNSNVDPEASSNERRPPSPSASTTSAPATPATVPTGSNGSTYDEQKLSLLASLFVYQSFPRGAVVFREGDRADNLYIIVRGAVEVSAVVESGVVVLNRLEQSQFFGEISLLFPTVRSATITTLEPCVLLCLAAAKFARFLSIAPELRQAMEFSIGPRVASIIENIPFFRSEIRENKPWSKLGLLGELCAFEKREENEIIYRQGERGNKFYVIIAGAVLITKSDERNVSGAAGAASGTASAEAATRRLSGGTEPAKPTPTPTAAGPKMAQIEAARRKKGLHHRQPTNVPGVILRRGNYFAEQCLISTRPHWGTATSLALSVFLTLTRENFDKYTKIAPELKELFMKREASHREEEAELAEEEGQDEANAQAVDGSPAGADSSSPAGDAASPAAGAAAGGANLARSLSPISPGTPSSRKRGLLASVAANQSLESSPIFDTHAEAEFRPSGAVAALHPDLHRLTTVASTPAPRRSLGPLGGSLERGAVGATGTGAASPLDRPALGRPSSIPALQARPASLSGGNGSGGGDGDAVFGRSATSPSSPGGLYDSASMGPLGRPARLSALGPVQLDKSRSTMARFEHGPTDPQGPPAGGLAPLGQPKQRAAVDKELQAYEAQNVRS